MKNPRKKTPKNDRKMIKIDFYGFFFSVVQMREWVEESKRRRTMSKKERKTITQWLIKEFHLPPRRRVGSPDRADNDDYENYPKAGVEWELNSEFHVFDVSFYGGKTSHFFFSVDALPSFPLPIPFVTKKKEDDKSSRRFKWVFFFF